ncbi:hypothetical protein J6590_020934 [Homalodisca vitripennis]|nr:hypothetical protein J6590_020934 [Homalodisca vitripennis]
MKKAWLENRNKNDAMNFILFTYRTIPSASKGQSPPELLHGRQLKTFLAFLQPEVVTITLMGYGGSVQELLGIVTRMATFPPLSIWTSSLIGLVVPMGPYPTVSQADIIAIIESVRVNPRAISKWGYTEHKKRRRLHTGLRMNKLLMHSSSRRMASELTLGRSVSSQVESTITVDDRLRKHLHRVSIFWKDHHCRVCDEQEETAEHLLID